MYYKTFYTWKSQTGRPKTDVLNCAKWTLFSSCVLRNSYLCENISRPRNIIDPLNQITGSLKTLVIIKALKMFVNFEERYSTLITLAQS